MRLLSGDDISTILRGLTPQNASQLLDALESGMASLSTEKSKSSQERTIYQPLRTVIQTPDLNTTLVMPVSNSSTTSVKVATVPNKGDIKGAITLYSPVGELEGILNAAEITAFRTALATMTLLVRWPAPSESNLVVFGAGKQAEWHIRLALLLISGLTHITVINRSKGRADRFEDLVLAGLKRSYPDVGFDTITREGNSQYQEQLRKTLAAFHVICCCTPSVEPLFSAKDLQEGTVESRFLSLIGSYKPEMQEVDTDTIRLGGKIWVDSKEACVEEAGELIRVGLSYDDLIEVGDFFSEDGETKQMLAPRSALTIFKCVGFGLMDLVVSKAILQMAEDSGKGTVFETF